MKLGWGYWNVEIGMRKLERGGRNAEFGRGKVE